MLPCNMTRFLQPSSRSWPRRNPSRISRLHTPVFHRSATITFQTTSPLFKKHRGYTPKKRTPGETPAAQNPFQNGTAPPTPPPKPHISPRNLPPSQSFRSSCAPIPLHVQFAPSLQRVRRLGPQFGSALAQG